MSKKTMQDIPTIVIQLNGGLVTCVNADRAVRVIILDEDIESADEDAVQEINGEEACVLDFVITEPAESTDSGISDGIEPDFVAYIAEEVDH